MRASSFVRRLAALRSREAGFALIELLIAMTVLAVGLLAVLGSFTSGYVALNRANTQATATLLADRTMEAYHGKRFTDLPGSGTTSVTYSATSTPASPDGRTYTVQSTVADATATNTSGSTARTLKVITVTVTDSKGHQWVNERSTFDALTGS
jgi:prepilin-type N-terminal cleavage/methylation domain-containing protein